MGYSIVLNESDESDESYDMYDARLTLRNTRDIPYVIFLDDEVIYSDYPAPSGSIADRYSNETAREIAIILPPGYMGKTLTIMEYLTPQQMSFWYPASVEIASAESAGVFAVMNYGPSAIMGGMIAALLIILAMLFLRQRPYPLLLPMFYTLIFMISTALYVNFAMTSNLYKLHSLVYAFSVYCAADLLLIFLALKMKRKARFVLAAISSVHFLITAGLLLRQYILNEALMLFTPLPGILGFAALVLAGTLIIYESRSNRYFKYGGWLLTGVLAVYAVIAVICRFTNLALFYELLNPFFAAVSIQFYPLNRLLSALIMIVIAFLSVMEYISETTEHRARLAALSASGTRSKPQKSLISLLCRRFNS